MALNPKIDSSLHVLKGAVQTVLNTTLTTSVYGDGNHGRLTVEYGEKPTEEQIKKIEELTNNMIDENLPIETIKIDRKEAEEKYGLIIYDKFPVPAHIHKLTLCYIKNWNINCCLGPHVKTTKDIA